MKKKKEVCEQLRKLKTKLIPEPWKGRAEPRGDGKGAPAGRLTDSMGKENVPI